MCIHLFEFLGIFIINATDFLFLRYFIIYENDIKIAIRNINNMSIRLCIQNLKHNQQVYDR